METFQQSLKIALGLTALVVVLTVVAPRPSTLFAARNVAEEPQIQAAANVPRPEADIVAPDDGTAENVVPEPDDAADERSPDPAADPAADPAPSDPPPSAEAQPAPDEQAAEPPVSLTELTREPPALDLRLFRRPVAESSTTMVADGMQIRIAGVEEMPVEARCSSGSQVALCGTQARTAVRAWLRGRSILCSVPVGEAVDDAVTAPCLAGEEDVGAWIVSQGWARATPGSRYEEAEASAKERGLGIWELGEVEISGGAGG